MNKLVAVVREDVLPALAIVFLVILPLDVLFLYVLWHWIFPWLLK